MVNKSRVDKNDKKVETPIKLENKKTFKNMTINLMK